MTLLNVNSSQIQRQPWRQLKEYIFKVTNETNRIVYVILIFLIMQVLEADVKLLLSNIC